MILRHARQKYIICLILIPLNLIFIWGNSLLPGDVSGQISGGILAWLKQAISSFGWMGEYLLRKIGHFTEFAALGFLLAELFLILRQRGIHRVTMPLLFGMMAACADETIQKFVEGRGSSVVDVWIDTAGVLAGILALYLLRNIILSFYKENRI